VSKEINDFITGHSSGNVAGTYGSGPSLKVRQDAIEELPTPKNIIEEELFKTATTS